MKPKTKIAIWVLASALIVAVFVAYFIPSSVDFGNVDFYITDSNSDYEYKVNEQLTFTLSDSSMYGRSIVWYFGNGDSLVNEESVSYTYLEEGKYMITLVVDTKFKINHFIDVVEADSKIAKDSLVQIQGPELGYIGEELVFSSYGPGIESWFWEFGETGYVDAYEGQVVYVYRDTGTYTVKLKTNMSEYTIDHKIKILSLFEAIDESDPVDSLQLIHDDIKRHLQAIADGGIGDKRSFYDNKQYIENTYACKSGAAVVVVVNGKKYNDFYSYCQGLHSLEGRGERSLTIDDVVKITRTKGGCLTKIEVNQTIIEL